MKTIRGAGRLLLLLGACPTSLLLYSSYSYLPVGLSTTLHFIFPLVMAVYLRIFYRERLKKNQVFCLVLTLLGLAMASSSSFGGGSFPGIVLAVASGFTWAFYMVYIQKSGLTALPPAVLNFYLCLGNLVTSGLFCLATGNLVLYSANWVWSVVLVTALLQRILANILYQLGMRHISPLSTGILSTFEPLTSILFGALYLKEHLLPFQLAGAFLILCAICANVLSEHFPVFRKAAAQTEKSLPVKRSV